MDTASLLGGNEIIVAQLFHEQHKRDYNDEEKLVVDWALETLWPMKAVEDFKSKAVIKSQKNFTSLFPLMVQKDLASKYVMVLYYWLNGCNSERFFYLFLRPFFK